MTVSLVVGTLVVGSHVAGSDVVAPMNVFYQTKYIKFWRIIPNLAEKKDTHKPRIQMLIVEIFKVACKINI